MIRVEKLCKSFGRLRVLDQVDVRIDSASVTAVLGPNASGKSTLIKSILGLVRPDSGEILIGGVAVNGQWAYRAGIGYMPQIARFPENLKVRELIQMLMDIRGVDQLPDTDLFTAFSLDTLMDRQLRVLSGGTRQKINAATALMFAPDILILDEPTAGLDPIAIAQLKEKVQQEREAGKTVLLTTHNMHEVEQLADNIVFLLDGRTRFDGSITDLKSDTRQPHLEGAIISLMEETS